MGALDISKLRGLEVFDVLDGLVEANVRRRGLVQLAHVMAAEAAGGL